MIELTLTREQAFYLLDAIELRIDDLNECLPSAHARANYRGDETSLEELSITISHFKGMATLIDHQLNQGD